MQLFIAVLISFFSVSVCQAQHEYDVWYFGYGLGIDFRSDPPTLLTSTPSNTGEGSANYCDPKSGEPLLGCDGSNVIYDRDGNPMPNGTGIYAGGGTSSQSAVIVPWPCSDKKFIVINTDLYGYSRTSYGSHYSVVDMTLNGGLGDVVEKNVVLHPYTDEHLTVVRHGTGLGYWTILHSQLGNTFYAYLISSSGIAKEPVTSSCGIIPDRASSGCLKASPNGRKLAMAAAEGFNIVELFDFDPLTGRVSNPITLLSDSTVPMEHSNYGVCFSPDNSKLYFSTLHESPPFSAIVQCDLSDPSREAILRSRQYISDSLNPGTGSRLYQSMEIGPDGKIYIATRFWWISVIENPNASGTDCLFQDQKYTSSKLVTYGLPNNIEGQPAAPQDINFKIERLQDTITADGIIMPILLTVDDTTSIGTVIGYYDNADIELIGVMSEGKEISFTTSSNGSFTIDATAQMIAAGLQLNWRTNGSMKKESTTIHLVKTNSCTQSLQEITLNLRCDKNILHQFMKTGTVPKFSVSPNPAASDLVIRSENFQGPAKVELVNSIGNVLRRGYVEFAVGKDTRIALDNMPAGYYVVAISGNGFRLGKSIVVAR